MTRCGLGRSFAGRRSQRGFSGWHGARGQLDLMAAAGPEGTQLVRSEACVWCRACWHSNTKHDYKCTKCGEELHGHVTGDSAEQDCFITPGSVSFLDKLELIGGPPTLQRGSTLE